MAQKPISVDSRAANLLLHLGQHKLKIALWEGSRGVLLHVLERIVIRLQELEVAIAHCNDCTDKEILLPIKVARDAVLTLAALKELAADNARVAHGWLEDRERVIDEEEVHEESSLKVKVSGSRAR